MKKYNITVNGTTYEVEVEEAGESTKAAKPAKPASAPAKPAQTFKKAIAPQRKKPKRTASVAKGDTAVKAPLPGTILEVKLKEGASVKAGDVIMLLEAMKLENEILAPTDGVIGSIPVADGDSVNSGDLLATIK